MPASDLWTEAPRPSPALRVCVVVPVRNEAAGLAATLEALARQQDLSAQPLDSASYEVLLLANNCQDDSAAIAHAVARRHPGLALHIAEVELPPPLANIGHVRRLLMDAAAGRLGAAGPRAVIASTDGDTVVAPDWLARTLHEVDTGADAVGGRITIAASDDTHAPLRRWRRCDTAYRLARERLASLLDPEPGDPWPRHHQHFCGSLAVTRAAYLQVGGLPEVTFLEDEALVSALRAHDLRVRHSPQVRVQTSGRQDGRAEVGLAWQLRQWAEQGAQGKGLQVEGAPLLAARFTARRQLRTLFDGRSASPHAQACIDALASRWQMNAAQLAARVAAASTFGGLWAALEAHGPADESSEPVPIRSAIDALRRMLNGGVDLQRMSSGASTALR